MDVLLKCILLSVAVFVTSGQNLVGPSGQTSGCDPGWETYNNYCFQFNAAKTITWKQAISECSIQDSSLVRIPDQATLSWVKKTMSVKYQSTGFWTGLNDNDKSPAQRLGTGQWKWGFYTAADMTVIQWNSSPSNDGISLCAGMTIKNTLSDLNCATQAGAICSVPASNGGCPGGWMNSDDGSTCFWITNTSDTTQLRNWADARQWCKSKTPGADLASVNSQTVMGFIQTTLIYQSQTTTVYWVGLQYVTGQKQWQWLAGGSPDTSIVKWQVEPDNVAGVENCAIIRMTGRFSDRDCTSNNNYICQKPVYKYTPSDNVGCGPWLRAGKYCYLFSRNKATWSDARSHCLVQNADLIKVDNLDKTTWLQTMMTDPLFNVYWTGLNDQQNEGSYVWADGSPLNTSLIVWNREPNNYKGREDCALISSNGGYNDYACDQHAAAICEIPQTTTCPTGWVANGGSCYLFTDYSKPTSLFIQSEAVNYCIQQDKIINSTVSLLTVNSKAEKAFIKKKLLTMADNKNGWWTSLTDAGHEGFWTFADGSYDSTLVDWSVEPSQGPNDNCGFVNWGGNFHEKNCKWQFPYLCERLAYGQSTGSTLIGGPISMVVSLLATLYFYVL